MDGRFGTYRADGLHLRSATRAGRPTQRSPVCGRGYLAEINFGLSGKAGMTVFAQHVDVLRNTHVAIPITITFA